MSGMNVPDPTEHFRLGPDEELIVYNVDSRSANTGILTLNKEDHTLGNLLRTQLLRDERVLFAGYRMPHPLVNHTLVRIRTTNDTTPLHAAHDAVNTLMVDINSISDQFTNDLKRYSVQNSQNLSYSRRM